MPSRKASSDTSTPKKKRGRPSKIDKVEEVEEVEEAETKEPVESDEEKEVVTKKKPKEIEDILFKLPLVKNPLIGTPKQVQKKLDKMAIHIRKNPDDHTGNQELFDTVWLYMHGFLINVALKQFFNIRGLQNVDVYQEALIALRFKAIPGFRKGRGMSFLNFAKMCIRRHLITLLNMSKKRLKDQCVNQAISLDSQTPNSDNPNHTFANIIPDGSDPVDKQSEMSEAYSVTLGNLCKTLSRLEKEVLHEYLTSSSYTEIADDISDKTKKYPVKITKYTKATKAVDNALVRIRKKAQKLREGGKLEDIPLFII